MQYSRFKTLIKSFFCLTFLLVACSETPQTPDEEVITPEPQQPPETITKPPPELEPPKQQTRISAGGAYVCFQQFDEKVKCWGQNDSGQLGLGDSNNRGDEPDEMGGNLNSLSDEIKALTTGSLHACSLLENDTVKCWGNNAYGQLGLENQQNQSTPALAKISDVKALTAGGDHTCALLNDGSVKCWGDNKYGQIGIEGALHRGTKSNEMGAFLATRTFEKQVIQIATGLSHTCILLQNGNVKCWGENRHGQLGIGKSTNLGVIQGSMSKLQNIAFGTNRHAIFLDAGKNHTCVILDNGNAKCWGQNESGQLGLGDTANRGIQASDMGDNLPEIEFGQKIKQIALGGSHTCTLLEDGAVKCWGQNESGQLGLGNTENIGDDSVEQSQTFTSVLLKPNRKAVAIAAGDAFSCALLDDETVQCWGNNLNGQLGLGDTNNRGDESNEMGQNLLTVELEASHKIKRGDAVIATSQHTCSVLDNDQIKCWGDNTRGQLGLGDIRSRGVQLNEMGARLPSIQLGDTVKSVNVNKDFACAILNNDQVKCWGDNTRGQLGINSSQTSIGQVLDDMGDALPTVPLQGKTSQLSLGDRFACALLENSTVKCWGNNLNGQLGLGDRNARGDGVLRISSLPVDLGTGRTAKAIGTGTSHACAILDDDSLKCWGNNLHGQLGSGDKVEYGSIPNMGDLLPVVNLGTGRTPKAISLGNFHTCAILDDDSLKCWGNNESGQLGLGDTTSRGESASQMGDDLPAVNLGTGRTAKAISAGALHTCAILDDDTLKCWGNNESGQLGLGDTTARGESAGQMGDDLPVVSLGTGRTAKAISAGESNTCVVLDDDSLKCWGNNESGQLGLGDTIARGGSAGQMGDALPAVSL